MSREDIREEVPVVRGRPFPLGPRYTDFKFIGEGITYTVKETERERQRERDRERERERGEEREIH
jgi:hypothetical protein